MDDHELYKRLHALQFQVGLLDRKVDFLIKHLGITYVDSRPPPDEIGRLIIGGDVLGAVRLYEKTHKVNLVDAKRAVEEVKAKLGL
jgi:hypothetical protein